MKPNSFDTNDANIVFIYSKHNIYTTIVIIRKHHD